MPHSGCYRKKITPENFTRRAKFQGHAALGNVHSFLKIRFFFSSGWKAKGSSLWEPMAFLACLSCVSTLGDIYMWRTRSKDYCPNYTITVLAWSKWFNSVFLSEGRGSYAWNCVSNETRSSLLFPSPPSTYSSVVSKLLRQEIIWLPSNKLVDTD